jgi:PAS domain S-box-containing protein
LWSGGSGESISVTEIFIHDLLNHHNHVGEKVTRIDLFRGANQFELIVNTVHEPLLVLDTEMKIIFANSNFYNNFKVKSEETIGNSIFNIGDQQWNIPKLRELLERILPEKTVFIGFEVEHDFPTIGHKFMLLNASEIHNADVGKKLILLAIEDITESKQAEEELTKYRQHLEELVDKRTMELKESEERYRRLFQTSKDGILLLEKEKREIVDANPAITKLLGYKYEELYGRNPQDIGVLKDIGDFQNFIQKLNETGFIHYDDMPVETKGGKGIETEIYLVNKTKLIQCNIRNISERKQKEKEIQESLKEKEVLLSEIYHRVKNNMQIVISLLRLQSRHIKEEKYREMFKESQNRIISMSLVHEKLYQSNNFTRIDFEEYIRELTNGLFRSYGVDKDKISLTIDIENISFLINSAIPCGLIINELVTNSLKHAFPDGMKGEIKIILHSADENMIELVVSDNGIGIHEDIDFKTTKSLGLHLVTILAENQFHGDINLDRSKGTKFKIKFKEVK